MHLLPDERKRSRTIIPQMPEGCEEGIVKGMYKFRSRDVDGAKARVQLFGSGAILNGVSLLKNCWPKNTTSPAMCGA